MVGDGSLGRRLGAGRQRPANVVGEVDDRFADMLLVHLAPGERRAELDVEQLVLALGDDRPDGEQPALGDAQPGPGPHGAEEVVDGDLEVAPGHVGRVDREAVDLAHLRRTAFWANPSSEWGPSPRRPVSSWARSCRLR